MKARQQPLLFPSQFQMPPSSLDATIDSSNLKDLWSIIEQMFSYSYLYYNAHFRHLVFSNSKGYVHIQDILQQNAVKQYFEELESQFQLDHNMRMRVVMAVMQRFQKTTFISGCLVRSCQMLLNCQKYGAKPLYIEGFDLQKDKEQLECLLHEQTNVFKLKFYNKGRWGLVYVENPAKLLSLHGHVWNTSEENFSVMNYETCYEQAISRKQLSFEYRKTQVYGIYTNRSSGYVNNYLVFIRAIQNPFKRNIHQSRIDHLRQSQMNYQERRNYKDYMYEGYENQRIPQKQRINSQQKINNKIQKIKLVLPNMSLNSHLLPLISN